MNQPTAATATQPEASTRTGGVYQSITDQIVASIEAGAGAFTMPWHRDTGATMPTNALTGSTYNGVNVIALWAAAEHRDFTTGYWATYKQWSLLGGHCVARRFSGGKEWSLKPARRQRRRRESNAPASDGLSQPITVATEYTNRERPTANGPSGARGR